MNRQKGQALLELLLLAPLFFAGVLALLFFVRALNARLTLIHLCRDTALALGRSDDAGDPQALLQNMVQERGLQSLGVWSAQVKAALPATVQAPGGLIGKLMGAVVAERLTVTLVQNRPGWSPAWHHPLTLTETVIFKRGTWKAPYAQAIRSLMSHP